MITFSKSDVKNLDKLLEYLFKTQNKYSILEESEIVDLNQISTTSKELREDLLFSKYDLNKYLLTLNEVFAICYIIDIKLNDVGG